MTVKEFKHRFSREEKKNKDNKGIEDEALAN